MNYNGSVDPDATVEYELYDYSSEEGRQEIDNLLSNPDDVDGDLLERWRELHHALSQMLAESYTQPDNWSTTGPESDNDTSP